MKRILVVDDDPDIADLIAMEVEDAGYEVLICNTGTEALKVLKSENGDVQCILSDYRMPSMDGVELAQEVAKNYSIPFVIISGFSDFDIHTLYQSGVSGVLGKPINFYALKEILFSNLSSDVAEQTVDEAAAERKTLRIQIPEAMAIEMEIASPAAKVTAHIADISNGGFGISAPASKVFNAEIIEFNLDLDGAHYKGMAKLCWTFFNKKGLRAGFQLAEASKNDTQFSRLVQAILAAKQIFQEREAEKQKLSS